MSQSEGVGVETRLLKSVKEIHLTLPDGKKVILAYIYGFKNIQNLVRKIKTNKIQYHYCEVMACPSGCIGGGALIKVNYFDQKNLLAKMRKIQEERKFVLNTDLLGALGEKMTSQLFSPKELEYEMEEIKTDLKYISW